MSNLDERKQIIKALQRQLPELTTEIGFNRDICVLSGWAGRELLRRFGISAKPVAVRAVALNDVFWELTGEDWDKVFSVNLEDDDVPDEAWSVGIGFGPESPGRWPGHLVLTTRNPDMLLDLTLDQASRPERGINLYPLADEIERGVLQAFERGEGTLSFYDPETGTRVAYGMIPDLKPNSGTDWRGMDSGELSEARKKLVDLLEKRIKADLAPREVAP